MFTKRKEIISNEDDKLSDHVHFPVVNETSERWTTKHFTSFTF